MPAINQFCTTLALLLGMTATALAADYRSDDTTRRADETRPYAAPQRDRYGEQRESYAQPLSEAPRFNEPPAASTRYADETSVAAVSNEPAPTRRPRQLPVRFEPSTRRTQTPAARNANELAPTAKSGVVQASAHEPIAAAAEPGKLVPPQPEKSLTLSPPSSSGRTPRAPGSAQSLVTLGGSLAIVVGLFLLVAWVMRRGLPKSSSLLPREALEVLGRAPLAGKHQVHLLRCGNKMLLVCVTPGGVETLTEITDPIEVDRLSGLCLQSRRGSSTKAFQQVLSQFEQEPAPPSFTGDKFRTRLDLSAFESIGKNKRREGVDG